MSRANASGPRISPDESSPPPENPKRQHPHQNRCHLRCRLHPHQPEYICQAYLGCCIHSADRNSAILSRRASSRAHKNKCNRQLHTHMTAPVPNPRDGARVDSLQLPDFIGSTRMRGLDLRIRSAYSTYKGVGCGCRQNDATRWAAVRVGVVTVKPLAEARSAKMMAAGAGSDSVKQQFVTYLTSKHVFQPNIWIADVCKHSRTNLPQIGARQG